MTQTSITPLPPPSVEEKLKKIAFITEQKDRMDKIKEGATGMQAFAIHFTNITVISSDLPTEVVAYIKTLLADFAEAKRQEYIVKASEVIKA